MIKISIIESSGSLDTAYPIDLNMSSIKAPLVPPMEALIKSAKILHNCALSLDAASTLDISFMIISAPA